MGKFVLEGVLQFTDKSKPGIDSASKGAGKLSKAFNAAKAAMAAAGVVAAVKLVADLSALGAQVERTSSAFDAISGSSLAAEANLDAMRKATRGAVTDTELMEHASRLLQMGLVDGSRELGEFTEMAVTLGTAMGRDVNQSVEEFALLMANQSIPRLDTFGISASEVRDRMAELADENENYTREQRFTIAVNEQGAAAMDRLAGATSEAADSAARGRAAFGNLKDEVGRAVAGVFQNAGNVFADLTGGLTDNLRIANDLRGEYSLLRLNFAMLADSLGATNTLFDQQKEEQAGLQAAYEILSPTISGFVAELNGMEDAQRAATDAAAEASMAYNDQAASLSTLSEAALVNQQLEALAVAQEAGVISAQELADAQRALLVEFGLLTPAEEAAQAAIDSLRQQFESGSISAQQFADGVRSLKTQVDEFESRDITLDVHFNVDEFPQLPGQGTLRTGEDARALQFGGNASGRYLVGERGPELIDVPPGSFAHSTRSVSNAINIGAVNVNNAAGLDAMLRNMRREQMQGVNI